MKESYTVAYLQDYLEDNDVMDTSELYWAYTAEEAAINFISAGQGEPAEGDYQLAVACDDGPVFQRDVTVRYTTELEITVFSQGRTDNE